MRYLRSIDTQQFVLSIKNFLAIVYLLRRIIKHRCRKTCMQSNDYISNRIEAVLSFPIRCGPLIEITHAAGNLVSSTSNYQIRLFPWKFTRAGNCNSSGGCCYCCMCKHHARLLNSARTHPAYVYIIKAAQWVSKPSVCLIRVTKERFSIKTRAFKLWRHHHAGFLLFVRKPIEFGKASLVDSSVWQTLVF